MERLITLAHHLRPPPLRRPTAVDPRPSAPGPARGRPAAAAAAAGSQQLRVAFIGYGEIGQLQASILGWMPHLSQPEMALPGVTSRLPAPDGPGQGPLQFVGCFDPKFGHTEARLRELLVSDDVDCVYICSPDHLHPAMVMEAIRHGKHVVSRKRPQSTRPRRFTPPDPCTAVREAARRQRRRRPLALRRGTRGRRGAPRGRDAAIRPAPLSLRRLPSAASRQLRADGRQVDEGPWHGRRHGWVHRAGPRAQPRLHRVPPLALPLL